MEPAAGEPRAGVDDPVAARHVAAERQTPPRGPPASRTTTIPTPLTRREGQPVPDTLEAATAPFHCQAYVITMRGRACARTHVVARETRAENRDACIACPAGAARARLLGGDGPLKCAAVIRGSLAGRWRRTGKLHCSLHRLHRAAAKASRRTKAGTGRPRGRPAGQVGGGVIGGMSAERLRFGRRAGSCLLVDDLAVERPVRPSFAPTRAAFGRTTHGAEPVTSFSYHSITSAAAAIR